MVDIFDICILIVLLFAGDGVCAASTTTTTTITNSTATSTAALPGYYNASSDSGYLMYRNGQQNCNTMNLKKSQYISLPTPIVRQYTNGPQVTTDWNVVHDKDLDSNVYYSMPEKRAHHILCIR